MGINHPGFLVHASSRQIMSIAEGAETGLDYWMIDGRSVRVRSWPVAAIGFLMKRIAATRLKAVVHQV